MAKADGSVIIATIIDTEGVEKGTLRIKKEMEDTSKSAQKTNDSVGGVLAGGFKKLGKAIAAAGIVDMLVDFGKEAIELGSDLEEVQNVVDVTFTTMSDKVNKFAKDAQKTAGLSETMAKQYAGTFGAMADSFGFAEAEAYEMSTTLAQLAGDVASFYNLSQDEAFTKLKSVFTGETETLKDLGVVMTQTALDAYAMANGFDKTTSSMTEQEKVALRYQFVMDQLSSASGDFVRTQEGWANQSRVLALQWESLMATLGTGLIGVLSPAVQFLNEKVLPALQNMADKLVEAMDPTPSQELEKSLKSAAETAEKATKQYEETAKQIEVNAVSAEYYKNRLKELEEAGLDSTEAQTAYAAVVEQLNELYPELNLQIDKQTGLLNENSRAQLDNLEQIQEKYLALAVEQELEGIYKAQGEALAAVNKAMYDKEKATNNLSTAEQSLAATSEMSIAELESLYDATDGGSRAIQNMDGSVVALTGDQIDLIKEIKKYRNELDKLNGKIEDSNSELTGYTDTINELHDAYGITKDAVGDFGDTQKRITEEQANATSALANANSELEEMQKEYEDTKDAATVSLRSQIGLFDELSVASDKSAADIIKNWESQREAFDNYSANLQKAVDMHLDEALVKQLSDGSKESMAILNELVNSTDISVDEINAAFRRTEESREALDATMNGMLSDVATRFGEIYQEISSAWGDAEAVVTRTIRQMQEDINGLQGRSVTIEVKTKNGSYSYSGKDVSLSNPSTGYALQSTSVPYLASGAVIPPNAPFMAVLGDQRRGTNIEAPLATIQEAVSNVVEGAILSGFAAMIKEQKVTQEILRNIEIGDTVIGQAVDRYNEANNIMRGGLV